jgi:hypothetical protein
MLINQSFSVRDCPARQRAQCRKAAFDLANDIIEHYI